MKKTDVKSFLVSGFYFFRETFPYAYGEVFAEAMTPLIKRIVFMLLLLGNFKYLSKHAEPGMSYPKMGELLLPVLLSVIAVMTLPLLIEIFKKAMASRRKNETTPEIIEEYCRLLIGSDQEVSEWKQYYYGQKVVLVYIGLIFLISPAFLYYNWHLFVVYFVVSILFATVCTRRPQFSFKGKIGRRISSKLNRFANDDMYLNTLVGFALCVYIVICAIVIVLEPKRIPLEFIFIIVIGMRVQLASGKGVIRFFLWEAEDNVAVASKTSAENLVFADREANEGSSGPVAESDTKITNDEPRNEASAPVTKKRSDD